MNQLPVNWSGSEPPDDETSTGAFGCLEKPCRVMVAEERAKDSKESRGDIHLPTEKHTKWRYLNISPKYFCGHKKFDKT